MPTADKVGRGSRQAIGSQVGRDTPCAPSPFRLIPPYSALFRDPVENKIITHRTYVAKFPLPRSPIRSFAVAVPRPPLATFADFA